MRITKHTAKPWKPTISSQETLHRFYLLLASHPTTEMWPNRLPRTLPQSPQYLPSLRRFSAAQPSPRPHRDSTRWSWHGPSPFFLKFSFWKRWYGHKNHGTFQRSQKLHDFSGDSSINIVVFVTASADLGLRTRSIWIPFQTHLTLEA